MAKKVILKDLKGTEVLPITRGELVIDSSGELAFRSNEFLATQSLPGLLSPTDKIKIDTFNGTINGEYLSLDGGTMNNTNVVVNLNADLLDGKHLSDLTIWGQKFDGSGDVSGNINLRGYSLVDNDGTSYFMVDTNGYPQVGHGTAAKSKTTYINGYNISFRYGTSRTTGMSLTTTGNVLIGTTTDSGYKLNVNGAFRATGGTFSGDVTITSSSGDSPKLRFVRGGSVGDSGGFWDWLMYSSSGHFYLLTDLGTNSWTTPFYINTTLRTGIGTTDPTAKLHVHESSNVTGTVLEISKSYYGDYLIVNNKHAVNNTFIRGSYNFIDRSDGTDGMGWHVFPAKSQYTNILGNTGSSYNLSVSTITLGAWSATNNIYFDVNNKKIGIGTVKPMATLDVRGNVIIDSGSTRPGLSIKSSFMSGTNQVLSLYFLDKDGKDVGHVDAGGPNNFNASGGIIGVNLFNRRAYDNDNKGITILGISNNNIPYVACGGSSTPYYELLHTGNYTSYLGYIGTTAVLASSANQALTGITRISNKQGNILYLGNSDNSSWVLTLDICSHNGTSSWAINDSGAAWLRKLMVGITYGGTGSNYAVNVSGDSHTTGWSRAGSGFHVEERGVHYTYNQAGIGIGEYYSSANNEFNISTTYSNRNFYFNYRAPAHGEAVTHYLWNAGSTTSWATHTTGSINAYGGFLSYLHNSFSRNSWYNYLEPSYAVFWKKNLLVEADLVLPILVWANQVNNLGYITRYSISSFRTSYSFGIMRLCVGNNDAGTSCGCYLDLAASGSISTESNMFAAHFYENSDQLLKLNIQNILSSDNIPLLRLFDWKESGSHGYGLIAQELEDLGYGELVSIRTDGFKSVNYSAALSLIVGKLQVKIKELEEEIENLKNKN